MRKNSSPVMFSTLAVEGLFLLGFLFLAMFGAGIYRGTVEVQEDNGRSRLLLSYFSTCAKNADTEDAVTLYEDTAGQVLSFADIESGYAVRVYQQGGKLLEDYALAGSPLAPGSATVIGKTDIFRVDKVGKRTFRVITDEGNVAFTLRAGAEYEG
ncbi:DUF4860 domain-containing protein [Acutalibacter muris]|uniref:DUF4860 domain-containing protein n=2 Tax=Acutalibacter muris TaxID=1796620 RepID=UPI0026F3E5C1|nr:DUF4860 domain-containing protein [Acutalibacter muris]MCI9543913.1 DUF4860 domain-containing protein [Acutalibacter muris]